MLEARNPFETPGTSVSKLEVAESNEDGTVSHFRSRLAAWLCVFLYPVWLVLSFYVVWLLAWHELGHRPRPMLDDPKSIGGIMRVAGYGPGIILMLAPLFAPLGLASCFLFPGYTRRDSRVFLGFALVLVYSALWALTMNFLWWDPQKVVEWWFD